MKIMGIDTAIDNAFGKVSDLSMDVIFYSVDLGLLNSAGDPVTMPLILLWLAFASVFFTVYLGFINFRYFGHAIEVLRGKHDDPDTEGNINRFQALATSLSGTVGLGNIAGVAVAVSLGGAGAVFWMVLMGLLGMSTKFVEVTLGVKYRAHADAEHPEKLSGGPMYYLKAAFAKRNMHKTGSVMAGIFAVFCIGGSLGGGSNLLRLHLRSANSLSRSLDCCVDNLDVMKPGLGAHFTWGLAVLDVHDVMLLCS